MSDLNILRNDGGIPIKVPVDTIKLEINEPVSSLRNLTEVIQSLPELETLILYVTDYGKTDYTQSLSFLRGAKRLKGLSLRSMPCLRDCTSLVECESLEWLGLSRHVTKVFDFTVLPSLPSLLSLHVELPTTAMLSEISNASQLKSLEARGGFKLTSLELLSGLVNLQQLKLWSGSLTSSRGLSAFKELRMLNLGYSKLRETTELGTIKGLKKLELLGNKAVSNLGFLEPGGLEILGLFEIPKLDSLKPILRLPGLKEIKCSAKIVDNDLSPLVRIPTLERAHIPGRYKSALKKIRVDCPCVFKVGRETLKLSKRGPLVLETASEAMEALRKKIQ